MCVFISNVLPALCVSVFQFAPEVHVGDGLGMDLKLSNQVYNALKQHCYSEQRRSARLHEKKEHSTSVSTHTCTHIDINTHVHCVLRLWNVPPPPGASGGPQDSSADVQDGERWLAGEHQWLHQYWEGVCGVPR